MRKILFISDVNFKAQQIYMDQAVKLERALIRMGHDTRHLSFPGLMAQFSRFKSRSLNHFLYKDKVDSAIAEYARVYQPDLVFVGFSQGLTIETLQALRAVVPSATFFGWDGDPWPEDNPGRVALGAALDILFATNDGKFLDAYRSAGARKCLFMPNLVAPDIDHRYEVSPAWQSDVLWTGKVQHGAGLDAGELLRQSILDAVEKYPGAKIYGCMDYPKIRGMDYFYAISGARIGISINATNTVSKYHSDRFTHYSACGAMVLAKRVPDTDWLMQDKRHVVYFDTVEECTELAQWYLAHEDERRRIANSGMAYCHATYNSGEIAKRMLSAIDNGEYEAPWGVYS